MGRPRKYRKTTAETILKQLAEGKALRAICRAADMPPESTVREWVIDDVEGFAAQYARARDVGLDSMADETLEIANTPKVGSKTTVDAKGKTVTKGDMIEHRRLQVDTRKWYLSKMAPKKYGERTKLDVDISVSLAERLARAKSRLKDG